MHALTRRSGVRTTDDLRYSDSAYRQASYMFPVRQHDAWLLSCLPALASYMTNIRVNLASSRQERLVFNGFDHTDDVYFIHR